ncbi:coiled-coil domain-containing protein 13 [Chrysoperla carnea]|uniref:coiled-coil domain-containing protein 13 n=1 Tax=Chrysoperla carnea TaxID=189513 RepID=UPI001D08B9EB|nr:coiled-coil domain-containing protein 13 [Chrysoperla carnea]
MNETEDKLPIDVNLSLDAIKVPRMPNDILFPSELNKQLRENVQVGCMALSLHSSYSYQTMKPEKLQSKLESLEGKLKQYEHFNSLSSTQSSHTDLATTKIVELSKRIRELNAELGSYRTKCGQLENKIKQLTVEQTQVEKPEFEEKKEENPDQIKILSDKLAATSKKLFEVKNLNIQLTNELKQANRLLSQEIGESFTSITNLSHTNSNWRGRAQQIISLQQKLSELQEKLSITPIEKEISTNTIALRQIESNKRQIQEQLTRELSTTKTTLEETKKKLDGSRARSKVLENDLNTLKTKLNTLMEKSEHDNQLIQVLTGEIKVVESNYKDKSQALKEQYDKLQVQHNTLMSDMQRERDRQDNLQKLLLEREAKIDELKSQIREYQNQKTSSMMTVPNEADVKHQSTLPMISQEEKAVFKAAEVERKRLLEMVSALNMQVDNLRGKLDDLQLNLKREKQKSNKLNMKINRLESDKTMNRTISTYSNRNSLMKLNSTTSLVPLQEPSEELKNKLEICEEQILLLQTRIQTLEEEKKLDFENFTMMLENTRNVFHEELTQQTVKLEDDCE